MRFNRFLFVLTGFLSTLVILSLFYFIFLNNREADVSNQKKVQVKYKDDLLKVSGSTVIARNEKGASVAFGVNTDYLAGVGIDDTNALINKPTPIELPSGVEFFRQVAMGGSFAVAIGDDGKIYSWGQNSHGQLGNGKLYEHSAKPRLVEKLSGMRALKVAAGHSHALALMEDGSLWAWGDNEHSQIVAHSSAKQHYPVKIDLPKDLKNNVVDIFATEWTSFILDAGGNVHSWGDNSYGEAGIGLPTSPVIMQTRVALPKDVKIVSVATSSSAETVIAESEDGRHYGWGDNSFGQLLGIQNSKLFLPRLIEPYDNKTFSKYALAATCNEDPLLARCTDATVVARGSDGNIYAWGGNSFGELCSENIYMLEPSQVEERNENVWDDVYAVSCNTLMIKDKSGNLYACGLNRNAEGNIGILGTSDNKSYYLNKPSRVLGLKIWN